MTRHWVIGLITVVLLFVGFAVAFAVDSHIAVYALLMTSIVLGFAFGTAWIITQRTFSRKGDEATEWRGPTEKVNQNQSEG